MQTTSDDVLIGRIAGGDRLAMQVLFARHHVRIYRFVLRLLRDEMAAEDVIGDVFLDVWRQASRFEGRSAVSTWLIAIARFKIAGGNRRRRSRDRSRTAPASSVAQQCRVHARPQCPARACVARRRGLGAPRASGRRPWWASTAHR